MHVDLHLDKNEFSKLHNELCSLNAMVAKLRGRDIDIAAQLERHVEKIYEILQPAYDADGEMFDTLHDHYHGAGEAFGARTTWSMYEVEDLREKHTYEGAKKVVHSSHWGGGTPVVELDGDTWLHLFMAADKAICQSGDMHHCFIEGFIQKGDELHLQTGS